MLRLELMRFGGLAAKQIHRPIVSGVCDNSAQCTCLVKQYHHHPEDLWEYRQQLFAGFDETACLSIGCVIDTQVRYARVFGGNLRASLASLTILRTKKLSLLERLRRWLRPVRFPGRVAFTPKAWKACQVRGQAIAVAKLLC